MKKEDTQLTCYTNIKIEQANSHKMNYLLQNKKGQNIHPCHGYPIQPTQPKYRESDSPELEHDPE